MGFMNLEVLKELGNFLQAGNTSNNSQQNTLCPSYVSFDIYIPIITNIVVAFGFVGNCITFVSILCIKDLRTPTHMFIASLSFADICCLINQRFAMSYQVLKEFISVELFLSISGAFLQTSTNHTIALSVFRLHMIRHPLQFRQKVTFKNGQLYTLAFVG